MPHDQTKSDLAREARYEAQKIAHKLEKNYKTT